MRTDMKKWKLATILFLSCLTGCGSSAGTVQVQILDGQTETRLAAGQGITVKEALEEAEITLKNGDEVSPSLEETISEDGMKISVKRQSDVTITENGQAAHATFTGGTVGEALASSNIRLGKHDTINHDLGAYLADGMEIDVIHRQAVKVTRDGKKKKYYTAAETVEEFLEEQNIELDKKDRITPKLGKNLNKGTNIVILRYSSKKVVKYETVAYETKTEYSDSMYEGETREKQAGQNGKKKLVYKVTYVDGKKHSQRLVKEKTVTKPVDQIIVKGTAVKQEPTARPQTPNAPKNNTAPKRRIVSKEKVYDCDGSGHGYYVITWSDGKVEYEDF